MAERTLNTRIKLRYASYAEWMSSKVKLLAGEVAVCYVEANNEHVKNTAPTVLFKVGDGEHVFSELQWASARAADVYDWAKAETRPTYTKSDVGLGNVANVESYAKTETYTKEEVNNKISDLQGSLEADTNTQYKIVADGDNGFKLQSKDIAGEWADVEGSSFKVDFTAINNILAGKADASSLDSYYTKTEADGKFLTEHQDISGKADKSYVDEELGKKANTTYVNEELAKKVDSTTYSNKVSSIEGRLDVVEGKEGIAGIKTELGLIDADIDEINGKFDGYYDKTTIDGFLNSKVDNSKLGDYYTKEEINGQVNGLDGRITANANAIEALTNGTTTEEIDSVMELVDYVNKHGTEVQGMKDGINANADDIDALEGRATAVEGDIKTLKEETIPGLSSRIKNYEDNKGGFALKSELFSGSYNDLTDKPNLDDYETIANVDKVREDVSTIKGDYLKGSDKTELSNAIGVERGRIDTLVNTTVPGIDNRVKALEEKPFDTYATKEEVKGVSDKADGIDNRLKVVEGDYLKVADKTELSNAISTAVAGEKSRAEAAEKGLGDRLTAVETDFLSSKDVIIWDCGGAN